MQGILLSFLLFTRKVNHTANVILAAGILALSLDVFHSAYMLFGYYRDYPQFIGATFAFPFLYGPIFYIYSRLISSDDHSFRRGYYLHFVPFILVVLYGIIFVYLKSNEFKISLVTHPGFSLPELLYISYLKPVHGFIYTFLTIKVVTEYNRRIRDSFSNIQKINLEWLRHLTIGLSIIWGIVIFSFVARTVSGKDVEMDQWIYMAASVMIYSIGYFSLRQPQIFEKAKKAEEDTTKTEMKIKETVGYQKSGLTESEAQVHLKNLLRVMESDKPFLDSELTLRDLADKLSMSSHNLSEILNTRLNQNFYDFINRYRVEEVKRRLSEAGSENFSLIAIAFDAGFNSKSSFNTVFKKQTGATPSQYRQQLSVSV